MLKIEVLEKETPSFFERNFQSRGRKRRGVSGVETRCPGRGERKILQTKRHDRGAEESYTRQKERKIKTKKGVHLLTRKKIRLGAWVLTRKKAWEEEVLLRGVGRSHHLGTIQGSPPSLEKRSLKEKKKGTAPRNPVQEFCPPKTFFPPLEFGQISVLFLPEGLLPLLPWKKKVGVLSLNEPPLLLEKKRRSPVVGGSPLSPGGGGEP